MFGLGFGLGRGRLLRIPVDQARDDQPGEYLAAGDDPDEPLSQVLRRDDAPQWIAGPFPIR